MNRIAIEPGLTEAFHAHPGTLSQLLRSLRAKLAQLGTRNYPPDLYMSLGPIGRGRRAQGAGFKHLH
ncbi:hypothetical protein LZC95_33060 [Pendulispora brunnea]|uniref:Uncharacterized protein n=1 Tax=Pendulispora brunnea TaxID=2905690 RepID=A0ABZ2JXS1_9BACT